VSSSQWIGCPVHLDCYDRLGWAATVSEPDGAFKARWSAPTLDEVCSSLVNNGVFDEAQMADVRARILARRQ